MGFNLNREVQTVSIDINSLTPEMMNNLMVFYSVDIPAEDVESGFRITERCGIKTTYPIISKEVVQQFYDQLDMVVQGIVNIVNGNYHTGQYEDNRDGLWLWGNSPTTVQELKDTLCMVTERDFFTETDWIYSFTAGDFNYVKPFLIAIVDLTIGYTTYGDYNNFVQLVQEVYPFERP